MSTTQGDTSHRYCTEGGNPKAVNTLSEVVCSPKNDSTEEEKESFMNILNHYFNEE